MEIKNLEKYVKFCRKHGVEHLKTVDFELKLTADPPKSTYKLRKERDATTSGLPSVPFAPPVQYSEDDLFWSAGGISADNGVENA
jgi:hypothetical protein